MRRDDYVKQRLRRRRPMPGPHDGGAWPERSRIARILNRYRYPCWTTCIDIPFQGAAPRLEVYCGSPSGEGLALLGPYDLPLDPGIDEIDAVIRAAVVLVDGEAGLANLRVSED